jgi:anti-sigma B factor antagonist
VRSMAVCRVTVEPLEEACVIRVSGELDSSTAERLRAPLDAARADGVTTVVDLAGVTFMDSAGLRVLLRAARDSGVDEWPWFIVRPSAAVLRLLALTGAAARLPLVAAHRGAPEPGPASVVPLREAGRTRAGRIAQS